MSLGRAGGGAISTPAAHCSSGLFRNAFAEKARPGNRPNKWPRRGSCSLRSAVSERRVGVSDQREAPLLPRRAAFEALLVVAVRRVVIAGGSLPVPKPIPIPILRSISLGVFYRRVALVVRPLNAACRYAVKVLSKTVQLLAYRPTVLVSIRRTTCTLQRGTRIGQLDRTARTAPDSSGQQTAGQQTQRQSPSATRQPLRALYVVSWRGLAWYTQDEHPPSCCNECGPLSIASIDRELIELARSRAAPGAGSAGPALTQLVTCACCRGVASYTSLHT